MKKHIKIKLGQAILFSILPLLTLGQAQPLESVQKAYSDYASRTFQEKLFVHLDRPLYVVGETMWFKAYCVEGTSHRAVDVSKVAYLEVLDKESNPVVQTKIALTGGQGQGNLQLPATLATGTYSVRCYTNWMKNFSPDYYFETSVTILNPFVRAESQPVASQQTPVYDVQFFPEGGQLISNLASTVAFRAIGRDGKGIAFKGALVNAQNDTLLRFQPLRFGLGSFLFTPPDEGQYRAVIQDEAGKTFTYSLPAIRKHGYVMQVQEAAEQKLKITVHAQQESPAPATIFLLAHTRQGEVHTETGTLQNGAAVFLVDKSTLGEGITHLTLFDQTTRPVAERLYFKRPAQPLQIAGTLDKRDYTTREKVHLDLTALAAGTDPATLSAAVYFLDSLPHPEPATIDSYLLLTSDLKGTVEMPASYFQETGAGADEALDLVMLTHGWTRFRWDEIATAKKPVYRYLPEHGGHFIKGKILHTLTGQPAANISTFLAAPSLQAKLFLAQSDSLGNIRFEVKKMYDTHDVIVQTNSQQDSTYRVEISSPYSEQVSSRRWPQYAGDRENSAQLLTRSINMQTLNAFTTRPLATSVAVDSLAFFGKPDEKYFLDAFTRFPTMEEVMREYVPGVFVRRQQGRFHFRVVDNITPQGIFKDDPLILLDGVPVFNTDKIMAFDPLKVKKLEVVDGLYYLGHRSFSGIVSYTTYKGDLAGFELDPRALVLSYQFAQSKKEFYAPRYDVTNRDSRLPDFRNLLHWSPTLIPDAQGKTSLDFYTSDQTGTYRVVMQGLTPNGQAGSTQFTFVVKPGVRQ
jgi:hypothetical protein